MLAIKPILYGTLVFQIYWGLLLCQFLLCFKELLHYLVFGLVQMVRLSDSSSKFSWVVACLYEVWGKFQCLHKLKWRNWPIENAFIYLFIYVLSGFRNNSHVPLKLHEKVNTNNVFMQLEFKIQGIKGFFHNL